LIEFQREGGFDADLGGGGGAVESDAPGVEEHAAGGRGSVDAVAGDGVAKAREMDADLVRAAGADADLKIRKLFEALADAVFGERFASGCELGGHADSADGVAGDGLGDASGVIARAAVDQRQVCFLDGAGGELRGQSPVGSIGAGDTDPHFVQHLVSVSASDAISDNWNPYLEAFWFSRQEVDGAAVTAVDAGAIYELGSRYALDGGVQIGVSRNAPAFAAFGGISIIVGDILGGHGVHARQRQAQKRAAARPRR